jgi:hypothetical protein
MNGPSVSLVAFDGQHLNVLETWFDEPGTQRRLGGRPWIRRALSRLDLPMGQEFRGMVTMGRCAWVALDEIEAPEGYVDGETYERYVAGMARTLSTLWSPTSSKFRLWGSGT